MYFGYICKTDHGGDLRLDIYNLFSGSWGANCYVLISKDSQGKLHSAVIDPSAPAEKIASFLSEMSASLDYIVLTHGHFDHIMSLDELRALTHAPAYIHEGDGEMLTDGNKNAYSFFFGDDKKWLPANKLLKNNDELPLGDEKIKVISVPGHSKGSICLLCSDFIITGDTLFANNIGRCDLYGGNMMQLYSSLGKLSEYNKNLVIYPGHGEANTLGNALSNVM